MTDILGRATIFAIRRHAGQMYGDKPYHVHLFDVVNVLRRFVEWHGLPQHIVNAAWLHDVVEDTTTTIDEVRRKFGDEVADLVNAVTKGEGKNRAEKAAKTYPKIRQVQDAVTLKLADRIANLEQCVNHDRVGRDVGKIFQMYLDEWPTFQAELRGKCNGEGPVSIMMWDHLDSLFEEGKKKRWKAKKQDGSVRP